MKLSIITTELPDEKGYYIAQVDCDKYDAKTEGRLGAVKYGDSKEEAKARLKKLLEEKGHVVVD